MVGHRLARRVPACPAQCGAREDHVAEVAPAATRGPVEVVGTLVAWRRQLRARCLRRGVDLPAWVFPSGTGTRLEERNVRHAFDRLLATAAPRHIRIHDLRHTYASLLLRQGESVVYMKEQLGHSSIQLTVDTYGHLIPGANRAAVDRLDDLATHLSASQAHPDANLDDMDVCEDDDLLGKSGEPPRNRTENPQIKSLLLCQLS
jgi:Phage integrase family